MRQTVSSVTSRRKGNGATWASTATPTTAIHANRGIRYTLGYLSLRPSQGTRHKGRPGSSWELRDLNYP